MNSTTELTDLIGIFTSLGFFKAYNEESTETLVNILQERQLEKWRETFDSNEPLVPLMMLAWDTERVWWNDIEMDVCEANNVYTDVLSEWSRISNGAFCPLELRERWLSPQGPVEISFIHGDIRWNIFANYLDDYLTLHC